MRRITPLGALLVGIAALAACHAREKAPLANSSEVTAGNAPAPNRIDKNPPGSTPDAGPANGQIPTGDPTTH